ncbi:MAG: hypothetical protein H6531_10190 [Actinobacteria bacterium]|nr:hypothetical protein [Thermoleophilia bacterium]MCB9012185.1 hypothetical protein [Actinomycetota bacterium]
MIAHRITQNVLFTLSFLLAAVAIWVGLRALVLDGRDATAGPLLLATGFGAWFALAAVSRPRRGQHA